MANRYTFREHGMEVSGSREELIALAKELRTAEGTLGDLRYQIEYAFDIDGVRSSDPDADPDFEPSPDLAYFAEINWCREDITAALEDCGYQPTEEAVDLVLDENLGRSLKDYSIESGWDMIYTVVNSISHKLTPQ
jgi:hypothetical protein